MELKQMYSVLSRIRPRLPAAAQCSRKCSGASQPAVKEQEIKIPNRIERGPTDILRALSSTLNRDYTAPHYKYHDDPFLIPASNIGKRTFALAKESGRKAAQWIMAQNPELFNSRNADPAIPAFLPRVVLTNDSEVTENDLYLAIDEARVEEALQIYEIMQSKSQTISIEVKQSLLEFLCFFNSEESAAEEFIEERWFNQFQKRESPLKKNWNDASMARSIFNSIQDEVKEGPQLIKAKCALLRGMAKYCQADKGWELYQSMRSAGEPIDVETYNQVFKLVGFVRDTIESRIDLIEEIMKEMNAKKVKPDLGTLNAILLTITSAAGLSQTKTFGLRVVAEFKQLGIKPSLASYYHLLNIFCRERGPKSGILQEIVSELEKEGPLVVRHPMDTLFFVSAMDVCRSHLRDISLAKRVHKLLHAHDNYDLIGDSYKESIYYRLFFSLSVYQEPLEDFMKLYYKYVPNIYIPEPSNMEDIIRSIEMHEAWELLPTIWSDMVVFDQMNRDMLISTWLTAAVKANAVAPFESMAVQAQSKQQYFMSTGPDDKNLVMATSLCSAAKFYWDKIKNQPKRYTSPILWTGSNLGHCLVLAVRANQYAFALTILQKIGDDFAGAPPSIEAMKIFVERAVTEKDLDSAVACICYTAEAGYPEAAILADELKKLELSENQITKLNSAIGFTN